MRCRSVSPRLTKLAVQLFIDQPDAFILAPTKALDMRDMRLIVRDGKQEVSLGSPCLKNGEGDERRVVRQDTKRDT